MRMKYHPDSGAFEHIPNAEIKTLAQLERTNKQLTADNKALRSTLQDLVKILKHKQVLTREESDSIENIINDHT